MLDLAETHNKPRLDNLPSWFSTGATPEQGRFKDVIVDMIRDDINQRVTLKALAGSGKSTLLKLALRVIPRPQRVLMCAFATKIVSEFSDQCGNIETPVTDFKSIHSLASGLIRNNLWKHCIKNRVCSAADVPVPELRSDKYFYILRDILNPEQEGSMYPREKEGDSDFDLEEYQNTIMRLVNLSRMYLMTKPNQIMDLAIRLGIVVQHNEVSVVRKALLVGIGASGLEGLRSYDFTDMLFWPIAMDRIGQVRQSKGLSHHRWEARNTYDWVLVDECQDLSAAQRDILNRFFLKENKSVFVGDPFQAIMGFAGSDYTSFPAIEAESQINLPLTVNFRSTHSIGDVVRRHRPEFQTYAANDKGDMPIYTDNTDLVGGDCIIARTNSELSDIFSSLLQMRKPCYIVGNALTKKQQGELAKIWGSGRRQVSTILAAIDKLLNKRVNVLTKRGLTSSAIDSDERVQELSMYSLIIGAVSSNTEQRLISWADMRMLIQNMTQCKSSDSITLVSGHRCKGLEFDRVHIYDRERFGNTANCKTQEEKDQEKNLEYVVLTRAKKEMFYLTNIEGWDVTPQETPSNTPTYSKYRDNADEAI